MYEIVSAISVTRGKNEDYLFVLDGRVPLFDYYRDAEEYARNHGISPAIVWDFRSREHAESLFGDIFSQRGLQGCSSSPVAPANESSLMTIS